MSTRQLDDAGAWVEALLDEYAASPSARPSPGFSERCRSAALAAAEARELGPAVERVGFLPLPFAEYLAHLCRSAGVAFTRLAEQTSPHEAARLAAWIGLPLRQLLVHLQLEWLAESGQPLAPLARGRFDGGPEAHLALVENDARDMMADLEPAQREQWENCAREVSRVYGRHADRRSL